MPVVPRPVPHVAGDPGRLTDRQQAVLDFVTSRIREHGSAPTLAEIADAFGFSQARSAQQHLQALEAKGHLRLLPGKSRGIRLLVAASPDTSELISLPILGRVAAGRPIGFELCDAGETCRFVDASLEGTGVRLAVPAGAPTVKVRYADFTTVTRSRTLPQPVVTVPEMTTRSA